MSRLVGPQKLFATIFNNKCTENDIRTSRKLTDCEKMMNFLPVEFLYVYTEAFGECKQVNTFTNDLSFLLSYIILKEFCLESKTFTFYFNVDFLFHAN